MNKIHLPTLGITTESENHSFRDDGFVPDAGSYFEKIFAELNGGLNGFDEVMKPFESFTGSTLFRTTGGFIRHRVDSTNYLWVIFYEHRDPSDEFFTRAHEETHVLHGIGQIHLLSNSLKQSGLDIDILKFRDWSQRNYEECELVANIGAYHYLHRSGILPEEADKFHEPALNLYKEAVMRRDCKKRERAFTLSALID